MMDGLLGYKFRNGTRAVRSWVIPYVQSRIHAASFRPVLCYLFTEWKCNIDCHYCHQYDNGRDSMSLDTAFGAMDWLRSVGCRVVPIMGGEPLLRKGFTLDVIRYGTDHGFFMYLPTNGYLMDREFIDEAGRAGVAAVNLAVDCVAPRRGLPKALLAIEPQFRYLVERQEKYGYMIFFNINICGTNLKDVKMLTEIAHQNGIGTDYHLNEPPQAFVNTDHYKHEATELTITPDKYAETEALLDWIIRKQREGWPMVNSVEHLHTFKGRMRGEIDVWDCRAGHNGALIRTDGTLSPCFDLICYEHDWGRVGDPHFDMRELEMVKEHCMSLCSSTCYHTMSFYYKMSSIPQWVGKHIRVG